VLPLCRAREGGGLIDDERVLGGAQNEVYIVAALRLQNHHPSVRSLAARRFKAREIANVEPLQT